MTAAKILAEQLSHATERVRLASAKTQHEDSELHLALGDLYGCVGRAAQMLRGYVEREYIPVGTVIYEADYTFNGSVVPAGQYTLYVQRGDIPERVAVPEGWKLVPVKPTAAMLDAAFDAGMMPDDEAIWNAMIEAAPSLDDIEGAFGELEPD